MACVELRIRYWHRGRVVALPDGDFRPTCDTCGYKGPRYNPADYEIAVAGIEAHIATVTRFSKDPLGMCKIKCLVPGRGREWETAW